MSASTSHLARHHIIDARNCHSHPHPHFSTLLTPINPVSPPDYYTIYNNLGNYQSQISLPQQPAHFTTATPSGHPSNYPQRATPTSYPPYSTFQQQSSAILPPQNTASSQDWYMYPAQRNSMGGLTANSSAGVKRSRSHQRTPSASTVASNGPASPYMQNTSFPQIANSEQSPHSFSLYAEQAGFSKTLPTPSQTPTESGFGYAPEQATQILSAHMAMKDFAIDHHNHQSRDISDDFAPSRQSMSSYGNDSPATPQSSNGEMDTRIQNTSSNDCRNPLQLQRTDSQVYQDELFHPNFVFTSAPSAAAKPSNAYLSPHRNLITERLQTANLARSTSPASALSRERSPFRQGSPHAPAQDWKPSAGSVGTAAGMRQQQKEAAEQAELARSHPKLHREPTKTISPKDAMLDYQETEPPLFQDSIPAGYKQHFGGTEQWPTRSFSDQSSNTIRGVSTSSQPSMTLQNATSADQNFGTDFDFPLLPQESDQVQSGSYQANYQPILAGKMNFNDQTPDFPPTLPSMESSISDVGPPHSSQESGNTSAPLQRPEDTRANTGAYTCTYHGCTQRFNSPVDLQRHKADYHRSQQQRDMTSPSSNGSASPRSSCSPVPSSSGMTSAALLARNSQAGPHKCTRINPSTNKPCNTVFSRPYDLTRHEDTIHNNRKQKVRCPMCREEKTFSRNDALTRHMRVVHPEVEAFGKRGRRGD